MTTQHQIDPAVITRIQKLMSLTTERGASEAEAALASSHVQRLLSEHNLSMAAVEASGGASGSGGQRRREGVEHRQVYKWQRTLMASVAGLNFCIALARTKRTGTTSVFDGYDLIGRVDNIASTRVMFEYLLQTIERLAREDVKDPALFFTRYAHSFKEGCADRLVERLQQQQKQIVEEQGRKAREETARTHHPAAASSNLPAIILSDVINNEADLNNDMYRNWEPGTTARHRREREQRERNAQQQQVARIAARKAEIVAAEPGIRDDLATLLAEGYGRQFAEEYVGIRQPKEETEAQRRKRNRQEQAADERFYRQQQRERNRLDPRGYTKGLDAGRTVSLNRQVDADKRRIK